MPHRCCWIDKESASKYLPPAKQIQWTFNALLTLIIDLNEKLMKFNRMSGGHGYARQPEQTLLHGDDAEQ